MEHYKKRLIRSQSGEHLTRKSPSQSSHKDYNENDKKASVGGMKHKKIARKRAVCRNKFRHTDMELFKLGTSIPTSLCKTKQPYNVCTEKTLQLTNATPKKPDEPLPKETITELIISSIEGKEKTMGRHSLPQLVPDLPPPKKVRLTQGAKPDEIFLPPSSEDAGADQIKRKMLFSPPEPQLPKWGDQTSALSSPDNEPINLSVKQPKLSFSVMKELSKPHDPIIRELIDTSKAAMMLPFSVPNLLLMNANFKTMHSYLGRGSVSKRMKFAITATLNEMTSYVCYKIFGDPHTTRLRVYTEKLLEADLQLHQAQLEVFVNLLVYAGTTNEKSFRDFFGWIKFISGPEGTKEVILRNLRERALRNAELQAFHPNFPPNPSRAPGNPPYPPGALPCIAPQAPSLQRLLPPSFRPPAATQLPSTAPQNPPAAIQLPPTAPQNPPAAPQNPPPAAQNPPPAPQNPPPAAQNPPEASLEEKNPAGDEPASCLTKNVIVKDNSMEITKGDGEAKGKTAGKVDNEVVVEKIQCSKEGEQRGGSNKRGKGVDASPDFQLFKEILAGEDKGMYRKVIKKLARVKRHVVIMIDDDDEDISIQKVHEEPSSIDLTQERAQPLLIDLTNTSSGASERDSIDTPRKRIKNKAPLRVFDEILVIDDDEKNKDENQNEITDLTTSGDKAGAAPATKTNELDVACQKSAVNEKNRSPVPIEGEKVSNEVDASNAQRNTVNASPVVESDSIIVAPSNKDTQNIETQPLESNTSEAGEEKQEKTADSPEETTPRASPSSQARRYSIISPPIPCPRRRFSLVPPPFPRKLLVCPSTSSNADTVIRYRHLPPPWVHEEPPIARRASVESISNAGSDYSPEAAAHEIRLDSKWYRLSRNLYNKIPKGKLRFVREKNAFVRYSDGNQMEQFAENTEQAPSEALERDNLERHGMFLGPVNSGEVIEVAEGVQFSGDAFVSEPETYSEEVSKVEKFIPEDFYGFYVYVTGFQIVHSNPPISFHTFLMMHNTNRTTMLLKKYIYKLLRTGVIDYSLTNQDS